MKLTAIVALVTLTLFPGFRWQPVTLLQPLTPTEAGVKAALLQLVRHQDEAIIGSDPNRLQTVFLPGSASSRDAFAQARAREAFLRAWEKARRLRLTAVTVSVRTPFMRFLSDNRVRVMGVVSETYTYHYAGETAPYRFGLGIRHEYILQRHSGQWYIRSDSFTDPLDQNTRIPQAAKPAAGAEPHLPVAPPTVPNAGAERAVMYANQFCGAAPGCGNDNFYNPAFNSFNGAGGDCTNFISQALQAGGFHQTRTWDYDRKSGAGDRAWVNAEGLAAFLQNSGRADAFARGRYPSITRPTPRFPQGAVGALRPGDLISYVERGQPVHTAIVVGFDPHGVPVVDSHTSDRYHVPWDLGWDYRTSYILWHVHYPK